VNERGLSREGAPYHDDLVDMLVLLEVIYQW
jgi:hypothetical protein